MRQCHTESCPCASKRRSIVNHLARPLFDKSRVQVMDISVKQPVDYRSCADQQSFCSAMRVCAFESVCSECSTPYPILKSHFHHVQTFVMTTQEDTPCVDWDISVLCTVGSWHLQTCSVKKKKRRAAGVEDKSPREWDLGTENQPAAWTQAFVGLLGPVLG